RGAAGCRWSRTEEGGGIADRLPLRERLGLVGAGVEVAAQRRVGRAAPGAIVFPGVAAARGGVDRVDEGAVLAHEQLAAGRLHGGGGAWIFAAGAGVGLAV